MDALRHQAGSYRRAPNTVPEVLVLLQRTGVPRFAAEVRRHLGPPAWWRSRLRRLKAGTDRANGLVEYPLNWPNVPAVYRR